MVPLLKVDQLLLHIPLFKFQYFSISFSMPHIFIFRIKIHNLNMTKRNSLLIDEEVDVSGDIRRDSDVDSEHDDDAGSLVDFISNDDEFEAVVDSIFGDSSDDEYTPQITSNSGRGRSNTTTSGLRSPPTKTITPAAARKIAAQLQKDALNAFKPPGDSSYLALAPNSGHSFGIKSQKSRETDFANSMELKALFIGISGFLV
jgi:hypothetical protein